MRSPYVVSAPNQIRALASPGREDIVDAVAARGPSTVSDLAEVLGKSRNALYYHVKVLSRHGLLVESLHSGGGHKTTAHYDVPGRPMIVQFDLGTRRSRDGIVQLGMSRLRSTARGFVRACDPTIAITDGAHRNLWMTRMQGRLTARDVERVNALFAELIEVIQSGAGADSGQRSLHEITLALNPVQTRQKRRRTKDAGARPAGTLRRRRP